VPESDPKYSALLKLLRQHLEARKLAHAGQAQIAEFRYLGRNTAPPPSVQAAARAVSSDGPTGENKPNGQASEKRVSNRGPMTIPALDAERDKIVKNKIQHRLDELGGADGNLFLAAYMSVM
jgi:hypothetical protein